MRAAANLEIVRCSSCFIHAQVPNLRTIEFSNNVHISINGCEQIWVIACRQMCVHLDLLEDKAQAHLCWADCRPILVPSCMCNLCPRIHSYTSWKIQSKKKQFLLSRPFSCILCFHFDSNYLGYQLSNLFLLQLFAVFFVSREVILPGFRRFS